MDAFSIRAFCDLCGDVNLTHQQITLRLCVDDQSQSTYRFVCPECRMVTVKEAYERIRGLLIGAGCAIESFFLPTELFEEKSGPPISVDDVIDFHQALGR